MGQANEAISASRETQLVTKSNLSKLTQCKSSLLDKLLILDHLDEEILDLVMEEEVENEIEQADIF